MKSSFLYKSAAGLILLSGICFNAMAEVAVIVNPSYSGGADKDQVAQIYLGKDKSLTPLMQKGGVTDEFVEKVLSRNSSQFKAYWAKLAFTGGGRPPKELSSDADVINTVKGSADSIGFVDAASVDDSVKVLFKL
ncbi:phosphate ABC transporter substrate-binding protein [Glaciecola sp. 1036]|uniref:phosphate ABC transporter substrate-binding protein n=1 Tax=Alteromonadaceae TaxID=72275 RepID=UPI003D012919